jgi:hypothetical protein
MQSSTMADGVPSEIAFCKQGTCAIKPSQNKATPADLNAMKAMVQQAKQDPFSLLTHFSLPQDLLIPQLEYLRIQGEGTCVIGKSKTMDNIPDELKKMKAMVRQFKEGDRSTLLKNFALPNDLLLRQSNQRLKDPLPRKMSKSFISMAA